MNMSHLKTQFGKAKVVEEKDLPSGSKKKGMTPCHQSHAWYTVYRCDGKLWAVYHSYLNPRMP